MTNAQKKAVLLQYQAIEHRINRLLDEKKRWEEKATSVSPIYSDMPKGNGTDKIQNAVCRIIELEQNINREIDAQIDLREQITTALSGLQDERLRDVMYYRYIDGKPLEWVAVEMNYSYKQICRFHGYALNDIKMS